MENEGRTCLWPIYVDKETHKIIDTVTGMMRPVEQSLVARCKNLVEGTDSEGLRTFMIESYLTCNSDLIKNNVDFITVAVDNNTKEVISFINPPDTVETNERMARLINLVEAVATGSDSNGNANEFMTAISNVVARYCAIDKENNKSFQDTVKFWQNKFKEAQK